MVTRTAPGLTAEAVDEISRQLEEPGWLSQLRQVAWQHYNNRALPAYNEERWRRIDLGDLPLDQIAPFGESGSTGIKNLPHPGDQDATSRKGLLVHHNGQAITTDLEESARKAGVIFMSMNQAVKEHPDLVRKYFSRIVTIEESKFTALHYAFWRGGIFLYVPRNVDITLPLYSLYNHNASRTGAFPHNIIVVDKGARVTLLDDQTSPETAGASIASTVGEIVLEDNAELTLVSTQRWNGQTYSFNYNRAYTKRDTRFSWVLIGQGGKTNVNDDLLIVEGSGVNAEFTGLIFGGNNQLFDYHTLQDHKAPHSRSDLLFKAALKDTAKSDFRGLIHIRPEAPESDAYQINRNLILSPKAHAEFSPELQIENKDVRCTHGATSGPVDPEQLFYLEARGLEDYEARRLIVEGFFQPVMERIPVPSVREQITSSFLRKLSK